VAGVFLVVFFERSEKKQLKKWLTTNAMLN